MDVEQRNQAELRTRRHLTATAAVLGLLGVLIGAFAAHGLKAYLSDSLALSPELVDKRLDQFEVGVRYHLVHAAALLALGALSAISLTAIRIAAGLMVAGIVLFSGSLYLLVATNTPWLGAITPIGGVSWLFAWGVIAVAAIRGR